MSAKTHGAKNENKVSQTQRPVCSHPTSSPIDQVLSLQKEVGNEAVERLFNDGVVLAKPTIGRPGGIHEQEEDHVADQVMAMPDPKLRRKGAEEEKEKMAQAKGDGRPSIASSSIESGINSVRGGGSMLAESIHANEHLDAAEGILVGLTAAIALNCRPCIRYYQSRAEKAGISEGKVSEVVAKIMAVSANKKRLQTEEVLNRHKVQGGGEFWGRA
jgi:alkylhydroperoxidase/carboxymuconolactone decarboxylase family protein YurZ